uniref:FF domain-containing protein n=1 Tax=Ditylenchus dipsaci TaxID=166011 RepID=A0A915ERV1_9BILA
MENRPSPHSPTSTAKILALRALKKCATEKTISKTTLPTSTKEEGREKKKKEEAKVDFKELLTEQIDLHPNERYKCKYLDSSTREQIFREYVATLPPAEATVKDEEQSRRRFLSKCREIALKIENVKRHEQTFKAMLTDLIKTMDIGWHDARKQLRKDSRYDSVDLLDKASKEKLFDEHINSLDRKRRDLFFQILSDHDEISFNMKWRDARGIIEEDDKFSKVRQSEKKTEKEYREWVGRKHEQIHENEQHLKDILAVLENDKRYLILNECPDERERLLEDYIEELDRKGPPPPPTTNQDPERRRK